LPISGDGPLIHDGWIVLLIAAVGEIDFINRPLVKIPATFGPAVWFGNETVYAVGHD